MKRSLLISFAVSILFAFACKQSARVTNVAPTPALTTKQVTITLKADDTGNCVISEPEPSDITLSRAKKEGIQWCVKYDCRASAVRLLIDDFHDSAKALRNPFGDHSGRTNSFDFGPFYPGDTDCTKRTVLPTGENGHYKYRLILVGPDGKLAAKDKDPGVIIAD